MPPRRAMAAHISILALVLLAFASGRVEAAIGPRATLTIANQVIAPDGFPRSAVLAGGTFPGPLIRGKTGDRLNINVVNALADKTMAVDTTIHWHGLFQKGTNWADGVAMVTQCPITPGHSFLYDFGVPEQAGTFWYHSHHTATGYVVPWSSTRRMTLTSIYMTLMMSRPCSRLEIGIIYLPPNFLGFHILMRLSSMALAALLMVPNPLSDGEDTQPLEVDQVQIFSGQRYSLILKANQPVGNYWIRGNPNSGDPGYENQMNSAILRYRGAPWIDPTTHERNATKPLVESKLRPLRHERAPGRPFPGGADVNINLNFGFDPQTTLFTTNNQTFVPPSVPVLLQILSGAHDAHELAPSGTIYDIKRGQVVELTMPALVFAGPHPMHLHGHAFSVIRSAGSKTYNYDNPLRRDVVNIGTDPTDNVTVRFVADNSGPWFLHCHIDWHLDLGFAVVFAEATAQTKKDNPVPKAWKDLCPIYNSSGPAKLLMGTNTLHRLPA
ncbi:multicopper oxidase family protein [Pleurotus pulmonarius]